MLGHVLFLELQHDEIIKHTQELIIIRKNVLNVMQLLPENRLPWKLQGRRWNSNTTRTMNIHRVQPIKIHLKLPLFHIFLIMWSSFALLPDEYLYSTSTLIKIHTRNNFSNQNQITKIKSITVKKIIDNLLDMV